MTEMPLRVLLVDDDTHMREDLAIVLRRDFGYQIDEAGTLSEARSYITHTNYHAGVIIDYIGTEAESCLEPVGIPLMLELRDKSPNAQVIILTTDYQNGSLTAIQAGAYRVINKPVYAPEIAFHISQAAEYGKRQHTAYNEQTLEHLVTITSRLLSDHDLPTMLETVVQGIHQLGLDRVGCYLVTNEHNQLVGTAQFGLGTEFIGRSILLTDNTRLTLLALPHPCITLQTQPLNLYIEQPLIPDAPMEWAYVPLIASQDLIGLVVFDNLPSARSLTGDVLKLAGLFAHQVATLIANTRRIQTIKEVSSAICSLQPWEDIFETVCHVAVDLFNVDHSGLVIFNIFEGIGHVVSEYPNLGTVGFEIPVTDVSAEEALIAHHQPLVVEHVAEEKSLGQVADILAQFDIRSILIVPVVYRGRVLGSFSLDAIGKTRRFLSEEIELCTLFATQVAVAIENQNVYRRHKEKADRLRTLHLLTQEMSATLEFESVLELIAEQAAYLVKAHYGLFLLVDPDSHSLIKAMGHGYTDEQLRNITSEEIHDGVTGWVLRTKEVAVTKDVQADKRSHGIALANAKQHNLGPLLVAPLLVHDKIIGTLTVVNRAGVAPFTQEDQDLVTMFANQAAIVIEKARLYHESELRQRLLAELDEVTRALRTEKALAKLLREIVRFAVNLSEGTAAILLKYRVGLNDLEVLSAFGLPGTLEGQHLTEGSHIIWDTARTGRSQCVDLGSMQFDSEPLLANYNFKAGIVVPFRYLGAVEEVLFVATTKEHGFTSVHQEILERLAQCATDALRSSRLLSFEHRMFARHRILYRVAEYLQVANDLKKSLHAVLTGVTAGYGLGFNRAALLLLDPTRTMLVGKFGIGHLEEDTALQDWEQIRSYHLDDFYYYREQLESNELPLTPLGQRIQELCLPLAESGCDLFVEVLQERRPITITPEQIDQLPPAFSKMFNPAVPLAIVPLLIPEGELGLLVVDNKFTQLPIVADDLETLVTFANMAAVAIENDRLFSEIRNGEKQLRALYKSSNPRFRSRNPRQVLEDATQVREEINASWMSVLLIDSEGRVRDLVTKWEDQLSSDIQIIRPDGISMQVMQSGQPKAIPNSHEEPAGVVNPNMIENHVRAALCVPLLLQEEPIGVMWFHYDQPHHFTESEINSLQLYVNNIAIAYDNVRHIAELEYMRDAAEALASAAALPEVLNQIVHRAKRLLGADSAVIWSYDDIQRKFVAEKSVADGVDTNIWEAAKYLEPPLRPNGTAHEILQQGWIGVTNLSNREKYPFIGERSRTFLQQISAESFQGIALKVGDECLGILYVNYSQPQYFSANERQISQMFANHAALALKKAKLLEQVKLVRDSAQAISEALVLGDALESTLQAMADQVRAVLNCDAITVYVHDVYTEKIWYPPITSGVNFPDRVRTLTRMPKDSLVLQMLRQQEPYPAEDTSTDPHFQGRRFTKDEGISSCLAIPLQVSKEKVGVVFVNYRAPHKFLPDELANNILFANQIATAIRNAQLYQQLQQRIEILQVLSRAGHAVTESLTSEDILKQIAEHALKLVDGDPAKGCLSDLVLVEEGRMRFALTCPPNIRDDLRHSLGEINLAEDSKIGVTGRAIVSKRSIRLDNAQKDPDYLMHNPDIRSELVVPIKRGDDIIGAINLEHPDEAAFNEDHQRALEVLADYAAIALQNAKSFDEVQRTKETLALRTIVTSMGIFSSVWRHSLEKGVTKIHDAIVSMKQYFEQGEPIIDIDEKIASILKNIAEVRAIKVPKSPNEDTEPIYINKFVSERIQNLQRNGDWYTSVNMTPRLRAPNNAVIHANPILFQESFDLLIDNAIAALQESKKREIYITTQRVEDRIEILVKDTGCGIPEHIQKKLGLEPIEKLPGTKGQGMGFLIARTIAQIYHGDLTFTTKPAKGTVMRLSLPCQLVHIKRARHTSRSLS